MSGQFGKQRVVCEHLDGKACCTACVYLFAQEHEKKVRERCAVKVEAVAAKWADIHAVAPIALREAAAEIRRDAR